MKFNQPSVFIKNFITLLSGIGLSQLLQFALLPVLSRLYSPEEFGAFAFFLTITTTIGTISAGRYEYAIVLAKDNKNAINLILLSLIFTAIVVSLTLISIIIFYCLNLFSSLNKLLGSVSLLIPLTVFLIGSNQIFLMWSIRKQSFKVNSIARITQSISQLFTNLVFFWTGKFGLILGQIISYFFSTIFLIKNSDLKRKDLYSNVSFHLIKSNFFIYSNFLKYNMFHALMDSLQDVIIVLLINIYFNEYLLGQYFFSCRIIRAPISFISYALGQIFLSEFNKRKSAENQLFIYLKHIIIYLCLISIPIMLIIFFFAIPIFKFTFGEKWIIAGKITQILAPVFFFSFIISPISCITIVLNKQKQALMLAILDISLRIMSLIIGGLNNDLYLSIKILSLSNCILLAFSGIWYLAISRKQYALAS